LSLLQPALATAFQRLFEDNLYRALIQTRWAADTGWAKSCQAFFGAMPVRLRWFVPALVRRVLLAQLRGHGMGRHTAAEIHAIGCHDLTAIAVLVGEELLMVGEQPTSLDDCAHAQCGQSAVGARRVSDPGSRAGASRLGGQVPGL